VPEAARNGPERPRGAGQPGDFSGTRTPVTTRPRCARARSAKASATSRPAFSTRPGMRWRD